MTNLHAATRRELLIASGTLFAWAYLPKIARAEGRDPRLLVIVLRGALDGLAAVAPVGDPDWLALRGNSALTLDGKPAALPLDSFFALNPAMPNLHRLYTSGAAAIVHAAATPYRERSHFDGQDVLESGLPKPGAADSGWLNRALASLQPAGPAGRAAHRRARFRRMGHPRRRRRDERPPGNFAGRARWRDCRNRDRNEGRLARNSRRDHHRVRPHGPHQRHRWYRSRHRDRSVARRRRAQRRTRYRRLARPQTGQAP